MEPDPHGRRMLECGICLDEVTDSQTALINNSRVCIGCMDMLVTRVIEDDDEYPGKLNGQPLALSQFSGYLDPAKVAQYKQKKLEHTTFPAHRVYCRCGKYLGRRQFPRSGEDFLVHAVCSRADCREHYCLLCASHLNKNTLLAATKDHNCKEKRNAFEIDKQKMLDSNERGIKFQLCPTCTRPIQLTEACHHIQCNCGTEFCYLCGNKATADSGHWRAGGCPRYPSAPDREEPVQPFVVPDRRFFGDFDAVDEARINRRMRHDEVRILGENNRRLEELDGRIFGIPRTARQTPQPQPHRRRLNLEPQRPPVQAQQQPVHQDRVRHQEEGQTQRRVTLEQLASAGAGVPANQQRPPAWLAPPAQFMRTPHAPLLPPMPAPFVHQQPPMPGPNAPPPPLPLGPFHPRQERDPGMRPRPHRSNTPAFPEPDPRDINLG